MAVNLGLVVTHGDLGAELIRLTELILGPEQDLASLSNHGLSARELHDRIAAWLAEHVVTVDHGVVIFVDDFGGSCATAAQLVCHDRSDIAVLTGINLAMILGFLTWRDSLPLTELAQKLVETGRGAINRIESSAGGGKPA